MRGRAFTVNPAVTGGARRVRRYLPLPERASPATGPLARPGRLMYLPPHAQAQETRQRLLARSSRTRSPLDPRPSAGRHHPQRACRVCRGWVDTSFQARKEAVVFRVFSRCFVSKARSRLYKVSFRQGRQIACIVLNEASACSDFTSSFSRRTTEAEVSFLYPCPESSLSPPVKAVGSRMTTSEGVLAQPPPGEIIDLSVELVKNLTASLAVARWCPLTEHAVPISDPFGSHG